MKSIFPEAITRLPLADIPLPGLRAHLLQGEGQQVLFMEFSEDAELPEHSHEAQWGVILQGRIDLTIAGKQHTYSQGDRYFIPAGVKHSARVHSGYADITYFDAADRYNPK